MDRAQQFVLWFDQLRIEDTSLVGGKNAALGEMYATLTPLGVKVPNGFAITATAYNYFIEHNHLRQKIGTLLQNLDTTNVPQLESTAKTIRELIIAGKFPPDLEKVILEEYKNLGLCYTKDPDVAVRSSATAEDLPGASFAGEQETYLNIKGPVELLVAVKKCCASLFTARAISYRHDKGFDHFAVALSVGIQKMVRSDLACSGVAFTLDTETGFDKVMVINGAYGLGELIVQGRVIPDEWIVFKDTFRWGKRAIISKTLGNKEIKITYNPQGGIHDVDVEQQARQQYCLTDDEALQLAGWCLKIEEHFSQKHGHLQAMDIEWAKDGERNELFIVQARPETVHSTKKKNIVLEYALDHEQLKQQPTKLLTGIAVGSKMSTGVVHIIKSAANINDFKKGEILVTEITDPDWEPIMKIAAGIITDKGGRTSHAAIVSRELGIPCIVGSEHATTILKTGDTITIDCSSGVDGLIYAGKIPFTITERDLGAIPTIRTKVMVNIGSPDEAFKNHYLPVKGVGLAREEFIIASHIKIHPNALIEFDALKNQTSQRKTKTKLATLVSKIEDLTVGYTDKKQFYVDKLTHGIAKIAASFWPYQVIVRFSDFKTNEYRTLLGGELYEPAEENPMIGWRGTSRYYDPRFTEAFKLEVRALVKAREELGMVNVVPMLPFCRTVDEAKKVVAIIESSGFTRDYTHSASCSKPVEECAHARIYMMCEIPSNVILADQFLDIFDGYSIGSNDLTQLTLGLDRDAGILAHIGNENNEAVKSLIAQVIQKCTARNKYIGICGQAPSDIPGYAEFLVREGISSISLNPDTVIKTIFKIAEIEK